MTVVTFAQLVVPVEDFDFEDIGPRFVQFLEYAIDTGATNWSTDLAVKGAGPASLRLMAGRWRDWDFEPPEYADALEVFADDVERVL